MIIRNNIETLVDIKGKGISSLEEYIEKAEEMTLNWTDRHSVGESRCPLTITDEMKVEYQDSIGEWRASDISEYAFTQLCGKVGVPASYISKCFDKGMGELAVHNFNEWSRKIEGAQDLLVREYEGTVRAVLSDRYNVFNTASVMKNVKQALDAPQYAGRYELNQIFLNPDKLHMRFVDFNSPLKIGNREYTPGFTISSSDVGSGSLNIKYFIYRFACRNGLVIVKNGGTLFRQTHLGDFESAGADLFMKALENVDAMNQYAADKLVCSQNKMLSREEMNLYLTRAQKELHLGKGKAMENLNDLLNETYPEGNILSFINAITENAQKYTLETRIEHEIWAGNVLSNISA